MGAEREFRFLEAWDSRVLRQPQDAHRPRFLMLLRLALALCSTWAVLGSSIEQELAIQGDLSLFCQVTGARFSSHRAVHVDAGI